MTATPDLIRKILEESRVIAVVGMSAKPERASHYVAQYLQQHGYRIIPVNPVHAGEHLLGEHCYATLKEAATDLHEKGLAIDVVDCFRKPEAMPELAAQAVQIGARTLWMQLGVGNDVAATIAHKAGMQVVMEHCMKVEHQAHAPVLRRQ